MPYSMFKDMHSNVKIPKDGSFQPRPGHFQDTGN